jgi:hypothetical protein
MRSILFSILIACFAVNAGAETKVLELKSDKAIYAAGETAVLRANFFSKPDNSDYQFDILATLNGQPIIVDRVTDFQMFSTAKQLEVGDYVWSVTVVIQDARYARDLKETIIYYSNLIASLDEQIAAEIDPVKLESLQKRRADDITLKDAANAELQSIRTPILAPLTLQFSVQ